jgi:hypothetical protein
MVWLVERMQKQDMPQQIAASLDICLSVHHSITFLLLPT